MALELEFIKKTAFAKSLDSPRIFQKVIRRAIYKMAGGDPELVHEMALEALNKYVDVVKDKASKFDFPRLYVKIKGRRVMPFGPAAGLDKNGDILNPLSYIFGFLVPGTVVVNPREGNPRPRVAVDEKQGVLYNAQGFPSKGLEYFLENIKEYKRTGGPAAPVYVSVCGIPPEADKISVARSELETLLKEINPYADGFVWNPFSPNTSALKMLRTPEEFEYSAKLVREIAGKDKLKMVKMGPYEKEEKKEWLRLLKSWLDNGGDGLVAVNTKMVPKEEVPAKNWGYPSAGKSGRFLQDYRQRAVMDARQEFPYTIIFATGGMDSASEATASVLYANAFKNYSPSTLKGFGVVIEMAKGLERWLDRNNYKTLAEVQKEMFSA